MGCDGRHLRTWLDSFGRMRALHEAYRQSREASLDGVDDAPFVASYEALRSESLAAKQAVRECPERAAKVVRLP